MTKQSKYPATAEIFFPLGIDEPIRMIVMPSGWISNPLYFHVITEYGDTEQTAYAFMSMEELTQKLGVSADSLLGNSGTYTMEDLKEHPDDQTLGKVLRSRLNSIS